MPHAVPAGSTWGFWVSVAAGCVFGCLLAGFVPMGAIMPALAPDHKGAAMAMYTTAAGGAAFLGSAVVYVMLWFGTGKDERSVDQYHNVVFEREGDLVEVSVPEDAKSGARFVLIAGQVLEQEVVQYGPFVLSSKEEVYQALFDYQTHSNGFERAKDWQSEIGKSMVN